MSKKFFVIADVHSFYTEMKRALDVAGFEINNPDHILISCGDALDRGSQSSVEFSFEVTTKICLKIVSNAVIFILTIFPMAR